MKAAPVILPTVLQERLGGDAPLQFMAVGNTALLDAPLLGLIASRQCPGQGLLDTLELAAQWARSQQVVLSGFHSPLEQQVLRSMLRRHGRVVKLLAHALDDYRVPPEEQAPLADGRLLVLSACTPSVPRTTRASSLARNRLVLALAAEHCVPYLSPDSPLQSLVGNVAPGDKNFQE
jgi:predicted Rossmann fold nucleotide-binding protein DprA/Smf involved in DNA uptake